MLRNLSFLILLALLIAGCTRDDLCPKGTATTPNLILRFKDKLDTAVVKQVEGLSVQTNYENAVSLISTQNTDSISLPININSDITKYRLIQTQIIEEDTIVKVNRFEIHYQRQEDYVNRACGFKMVFNNLEASIQEEPSYDPWIDNIKVLRDTVNDETKAHISIFH